jgi:crotonobetainyl-CoA:carnitine CoA-transferase CaiB-like acyl-CoA transferase
MFEAMAHFNLDDFTHYFSEGEVMGPYSRPNVSQSYVFQCSDGGWIALHMSSPQKFWDNLAEAVGQPDMLARPEFGSRAARIENYEKVAAFLAPIFATRTRADWCGVLERLEVPHSPVYSAPEVIATDQAKHLRLCVEDPAGPHGAFRTIRSPVRFDGEAMLEVSAPPVLGQHNAALLGDRTTAAVTE